MPLTLDLGPSIYSRRLGLATAEVYFCEEEFQIYIVGDTVASFLGSAESFQDCKEAIDSLQGLWTQIYSGEPRD